MRKKVIKDTFKTMYPSMLLETLDKTVSGYLMIFVGVTVGKFADSALAGNISLAKNDVMLLLIYLALGVFGIPLYNIFSKTIMFKLSLKHDSLIISNFIEKDYAKAKEYELGDISYRLEMDPNELRWGFTTIIKNSVSVIIILTSLVISILKINTSYGLICIVAAVLPMTVAFFSGMLDAKYKPKTKEYEGMNRALETDLCFNFVFIKMYKLKKIMIENLSDLFRGYYDNTIKKSATYSSIVAFINNLFSIMSVILIILFGAYLVSKGKISAGSIATMLAYFEIVKLQYEDISSIIKEFEILPQRIDRVAELYSFKEETGVNKLNAFDNLNVENLCYSYDGNINAVDNISFDVKKGEKLAIAGKNGSGKSTTLKILAGIYSNYSGNIALNNADFKELDLNDWRDKFAYIEQEPFIFKTTVFENVKLGNLAASDDEVNEILKATGLSEISQNTAEQFGDNFSGGEKQRISIARALLKNSNLLLIDEPFNNLDYLGKELIERIFSEHGKTIIFISHDNHLIKYADKTLNVTATV